MIANFGSSHRVSKSHDHLAFNKRPGHSVLGDLVSKNLNEGGVGRINHLRRRHAPGGTMKVQVGLQQVGNSSQHHSRVPVFLTTAEWA